MAHHLDIGKNTRGHKSYEIGKTMSIGGEHNLEYISRIDKVEWIIGLDKIVKQEEIKPLIEKVFKSLKEVRLGLYYAGVDIGYKRLQWLAALGLISDTAVMPAAKRHLNTIENKYVTKFYITSRGELRGVNESHTDNTPEIDGTYTSSAPKFNASDLHVQEIMKTSYTRLIRKREDWGIDDVFDLPDDVYDLIRLVNKGWQYFEASGMKWKRFDYYRAQAYRWLEANYQLDENADEADQLQFLKEERERLLENSLYLANKHIYFKDQDDPTKGIQRFKAWKAQELVLFLIDLGLPLIIAKLRQIGFSTVIGGVFALRTMISKNTYIKMGAQKDDKSEELFLHKIKFVIENAPEYLKPTTANWSTDQVSFGYSEGKGKAKSTTSTFEVCAPTEDMINAGTPAVTLLDEIGFMKKFSQILGQGRPTMFKYSTKLNKMIMVRQVICWGTGGKTGGAGAPMEVEWNAAKEQFALRNFRHGLIPLFINFYAKPGHTDDFYMQEKSYYYAKKKTAGEEDPKIVFHQSFPITEEDVFMQSADTIISVANINLEIERITTAISKGKLASVRGYFEPLYDMEKKRGENSYVPYEILGGRFIKANEQLIMEDSPFACIEIFESPDRTKKNLYYKGTDPIATSSGHSKFSTVIMNAETKKIAARLTYKSMDYRYEYLQSILLNLMYSPTYNGRRIGIKELIEINAGTEYYNFARELGYGSMFVSNSMLPQNLQTDSVDIGIRKGTNTIMLVNRLEELLIEHAKSLDSIEFWTQLKTFTRKYTPSGGYTYSPANKKIHYDDELDATNYAWINVLAHQHIPILQVTDIDMQHGSNNKPRYYYDENYNLKLGVKPSNIRRGVYGR